MQGQRSAIGSLPDSINFDYGSPTSNVGVDQQICWNNLRNPAESRLSDYRISGSSSSDTLMGGVSQEGRNFSRWSIGESSSSNPRIPQNLVSYDMNQIGWPSSINGSVGAGLTLDERRYEPTNFVSHTGVNLNLSSNAVVAGTSFVRSSNAEPASQNNGLNDVNFHRVGDHMDCPNSSSKSIVFENKFLSSASSSSNPFVSSSGSGGFLVEEDEGRLDCSLDGRRLSCKRKTLEGNPGQSSSSGSFFSREAEGGTLQAGPPRYAASVSRSETHRPQNRAALPRITRYKAASLSISRTFPSSFSIAVTEGINISEPLLGQHKKGASLAHNPDTRPDPHRLCAEEYAICGTCKYEMQRCSNIKGHMCEVKVFTIIKATHYNPTG